MYYRRKVLLALIEAFGGKLKRTDCQKLLFLFCQHAKQDFYDFFPYQYGAFSFLSYQDKNRLTALGYLKKTDDFELCATQPFVEQLRQNDRQALKCFRHKLGELRGNALIRKTYLQFPYYASRSAILSQVLTPEQTAALRSYWPADKFPCLFTIGYEGKTIDAYLNCLIAHNVHVVVDVRKNPRSMKYGFSKSMLSGYLERAGIAYFHIPGLGIASNLRQNLNTHQDYQRLFEYYYVEILPRRTAGIAMVKSLLSRYSRIALTCLEADSHFCHRHKIAEYLKGSPDFNIPIIHL